LAVATQALAVLPPGQQFLLHRSSSATTSAAAPLQQPGSVVRFCTEASLRESFVARLSTLSALQADSSATAQPSPAQRILTLCNAGRVLDALSYALSLDGADSQRGALSRLPIMAMAKACVAGAGSEDFASALALQHFLRSPTSLTPPATQEVGDGRHWSALLEVLRILRRRGVEHYKVAVRAALSFHSAADHASHLRLPRPLVDDMCGSFSLAAQTNSAPDVSAWAPAAADLLAALMDARNLNEACSLATRLVRCSNEHVASRGPQAAQGCKLWMPYNAFDRLILLCGEYLQPDRLLRDGLAADDAQLIKGFEELKQQLSNHFSVLLVA
jgi:hypothetical protein